MNTPLYRMDDPIQSGAPAILAELLLHPSSATTVPLGVDADLDPIRQAFTTFVSNSTDGRHDRAALDAVLVGPLHSSLNHLPRRIASDMRFWHWICVVELQEIVWARWHGDKPSDDEIASALTPSLIGHFLGNPTLNGVSRNALARLWWCGHSLYTQNDGYDLARAVLGKQDLFQAIFEREFGLYAPAARACVRRFGDGAVEKEWRDALRKLNYVATTTVLEALDEADLTALLI